MDMQNIIKENIDISDAIFCVIQEYENLNDVNMVNYLKSLNKEVI